jgi:cytochrome c556
MIVGGGDRVKDDLSASAAPPWASQDTGYTPRRDAGLDPPAGGAFMRKPFVVVLGLTMLGTTVAIGQGTLEKPPENYQKLMRQVGPTFQALGKKADAMDYAGVASDAVMLRTLFGDVQKFWEARKTEDALKFAAAAQRAAGDLETAAKSSNAAGVAEGRKALGAQCQACHMAHRDKMPDGSFGIK